MVIISRKILKIEVILFLFNWHEKVEYNILNIQKKKHFYFLNYNNINTIVKYHLSVASNRFSKILRLFIK